MRIILITSSTSLSGGTRQMAYLARGLADAGHEVTAFAPRDAQGTDLDPGLDWRDMGAKRRDWRKAVEAALPQAGPFVVHAFHNKGVKALAWWGLCWKQRGAVCLGHRGVVFRPGNPLPWWSPGLDGVTVNSRACARVLRGLGVSERRLFTLPNGIPAQRVTPSRKAEDVRRDLGLAPSESSDTFVFGTVAGDKPVKGVDVLLEAFAAMPEGLRNKCALVLAGCREERWLPQARALGIAKSCRFLGRVEHPADHLQIMNAFVLPSRSESMPNTVLEAFFFGLPVIGSQVGGVPELLNGTGLPVPPGHAGALSQAMARLADDQTLRHELSQAALAMSARFTLKAKLATALDIYAQLLERRGLTSRPAQDTIPEER